MSYIRTSNLGMSPIAMGLLGPALPSLATSEVAKDLPPPTPEPAATTSFNDVMGSIGQILGVAANVGVSIYAAKEQSKAQKRALKAEQAAMANAPQQQPTIIQQQTGMNWVVILGASGSIFLLILLVVLLKR